MDVAKSDTKWWVWTSGGYTKRFMNSRLSFFGANKRRTGIRSVAGTAQVLLHDYYDVDFRTDWIEFVVVLLTPLCIPSDWVGGCSVTHRGWRNQHRIVMMTSSFFFMCSFIYYLYTLEISIVRLLSVSFPMKSARCDRQKVHRTIGTMDTGDNNNWNSAVWMPMNNNNTWHACHLPLAEMNCVWIVHTLWFIHCVNRTEMNAATIIIIFINYVSIMKINIQQWHSVMHKKWDKFMS